MKICMISTRHTLDDARIVHKEAMSLVAHGHEVVLLFMCNDKYEYTWPNGKVIAQGMPQNGETMYLGMRVMGMPKRHGLLGKWKNYREMGELAASIEADAYHVHEPDLSFLIAVRVRRLLAKVGKRAFIVHDMHEYPWSEEIDRCPRWSRNVVRALFMLWDKCMLHWVDHVFTANSLARGYVLVLSNKKRVDVLYNCPSLKLFPQHVSDIRSQNNGKLILCHEGSLSFDRGLKEMVEAVDILRDKVHLKIIGDIFGKEREWLKNEVEKRRLQDIVSITGWLPYDKVNSEFAGCHIGLIMFTDCLVNYLSGPPNKIFNYMNAGLPFISVETPEIHKIVSEEKCGIVIKDNDANSVVKAIETFLNEPELIDTMGKSGQKAVRERYSWENMANIMLAGYQATS